MGMPSDDAVVIQKGKKQGDPFVTTVNCPDKTGLGCDLCWIILDFGLYIVKGDFTTDGVWCYIPLWVFPHPTSPTVETVAQFGVIFLLFALGLEFSAAKLHFVRAVAILGGLLQIFLLMCLSGVIAVLCGGEASEGVLVGAFLSMSSTAVVLKFLMEKNSISTLYRQVTVGTLILQDCAVGLLFALLPILGGTSGFIQGMLSMTKTSVLHNLKHMLDGLPNVNREWCF